MTTARLTQSLGELFRVGSSRRVLQSQWQSKGVPFYRGREITQLAAEGYVNNALFISEDLYTDLAAKNGVPSAGDIMVTAIGTIGNSYIVQDSDRFYFKDASVLWLKKTSDVSTEFINWWLKSPLFFDQLDRGNGATVDTLTIQKLQAVAVDLPPLPAQQRIVTLLDEAFAGIATAKANAEKNLQNARAIFESHLKSVFTQRGQGWLDKRLGDICDRVSVGHVGPTTEFYCGSENGIAFLRSQNVRRGYLDWDGIQYVTKEFHQKLKKSQLRAGDLLFVRVGANRGDCCSVPEGAGALNCANIVFARPTQGNATFLERFCDSADGRAQLLGMTTGSAQGVINTNSVAELIVPLPPLKDQMNIVERLNAFQGETRHLESIYRQKLNALDELKKSLLHSAFNGDL